MKKGWLEQRTLWKILFGCLILFLLIAGFAIVLITAITASFHNSDVYKQAMAKAIENQQVRAKLGEPIQPAWLISGQLNVNGSTGNANLSIPLSGPRGRGTIRAVAYKNGGVWQFTSLQVNIEGQPATIDLLLPNPPEE
jgi:hypothetical protein